MDQFSREFMRPATALRACALKITSAHGKEMVKNPNIISELERVRYNRGSLLLEVRYNEFKLWKND